MRFGFLLKYPEFLLLFSVALASSAFFVDGLWFLIGVALWPCYAVLDTLTPRRALGWAVFFVVVAGMAMGYPLLSFRSVQSVVPTGTQSFVLAGIILVYIVLLATLALFALWVPFAVTRHWRWRALIAPAAWVIFEFLAGQLSYGLRWFFAGEPLIAFPPLAVFSRFGGTYLLSFLAIWFNAAMYGSVRYFASRHGRGRVWLPLTGTLFATLTLVAVGAFYLQNQTARVEDNIEFSFDVMVAQAGSYDTGGRQRRFFEDTQRRTRELMRPEDVTGADLIVFPGNYFGDYDKAGFEALNHYEILLGFDPDGVAVLAGFSLTENKERFQATALLGANGARYAFKERLLPLADFMPAWLAPLAGTFADAAKYYTPRHNESIQLREGVKIAVVSCSEEFVPGLARRLVREGARLIIVSGSVDDFASPAAYKKSLRAARFLAIENDVYVVQAMKNGISAIIDNRGRVVQSLVKDQRGVMRGKLPL